MSKVYKYRLIGADHMEEDGTVRKRGEIFTSPHPLHIIFQNKFSLLSEGANEEDDDEDSLPEDVTSQFFEKGSPESGLAVYKEGKRYLVFDKEKNDGRPLEDWIPLNRRPLKKSQVHVFLENHFDEKKKSKK